MKNLLTVLSLVIVASPAFASRARLESLGEGKNGSYYINDGRNIFLNPAAISAYKKNMWMELGTASDSADASNASRVQGGFTNTFGDFTYGVYVGRKSDRLASTVALLNAATANDLIPADHAFEFFLGGEQGVKWGASLYYAGALSQTTVKQTTNVLGVKAGVETNGLNVFTTVGINSEAKNDDGTAAGTNVLKGKLSLDVGATYAMDDITYLAKFTSTGSEFTPGTSAATNVKTTAFGVGAGWKKEASKTVNVYSRVQFDYQKNSLDTNNAAINAVANAVGTGNETFYNLPLVLAAEAQATSWLTVRGSVSHSLIGQHNLIKTTGVTTKDSMNNMTTVAAGLGFNFGELTIDALFGQSGAVAGAASESSQGTSQAGSTFGFGDNMVSRLSLSYKF